MYSSGSEWVSYHWVRFFHLWAGFQKWVPWTLVRSLHGFFFTNNISYSFINVCTCNLKNRDNNQIELNIIYKRTLPFFSSLFSLVCRGIRFIDLWVNIFKTYMYAYKSRSRIFLVFKKLPVLTKSDWGLRFLNVLN